MKARTLLLSALMICSLMWLADNARSDGQNEISEQLRKDAQEMKQYLCEYQKDIDECRTYFEKEDESYKQLNDSLLEHRMAVYGIMQQMHSAMINGDMETLAALDERKQDMEHKLMMIELRKEMLMTVCDLRQQAKQYPDADRLADHIQAVYDSYMDLFKAEEDAYRAQKTLARQQMRKERAYKKCEIVLLDAERIQKIQSLNN